MFVKETFFRKENQRCHDEQTDDNQFSHCGETFEEFQGKTEENARQTFGQFDQSQWKKKITSENIVDEQGENVFVEGGDRRASRRKERRPNDLRTERRFRPEKTGIAS